MNGANADLISWGIVFVVISIAYIAVIALLAYQKRILNQAWKLANRLSILNAQSEYNIKEGEPYIGIVITNSNLQKKKYRFVYSSGIILLIEHFILRKIPFKLIKENNEDDPFDIERFSYFVNDPKCSSLYILGQGRRYGLLIGKEKKDILYYDQFSKAKPKKLVVQLHCNHIKIFNRHKNKSSLTDLLHAKSDFKQKSKRLDIDNIYYFLEKIKND